jgi:hypothetical protein
LSDLLFLSVLVLLSLVELLFFFQALSDDGGAAVGVEWGWRVGVAVQPAHSTVSLNSLTASSVSSGVLNGILSVRRSVVGGEIDPSGSVAC